MNKALWTASLSVLINFCAVAMDKKEYDQVAQEHNSRLYTFLIEMRDFERKEEDQKRKEQPRRLLAHANNQTPVYNAILFNELIKKRMYKDAVELITRDIALRTKHPLAQELVCIKRQIDAIRKCEITEGFFIQLSEEAGRLFPYIEVEMVKAAREGQNAKFLGAYKEAKRNSTLGKPLS
ncbi:MAG TPA: hypothetical protein VJJ26_02750 [Candidatus Babeliales bacterium]|nr:hypothetical protein [Candidatus Babeliales bacterium]